MRLRVGASTDVGLVRTRNEDAYLVDDPLFIVADGMGGHRGGDVASKLTVETVQGARPASDTSGGALVEAVRRANSVVHERAAADRDLHGMGTTITALQTRAGTGYIAHVGDSRAYLLRDGALQQLTRDHTLVQQMVDEGKLSPEEAERHPARHIMTRALGVDDDVAVDELTLDLHAGDRLLLCSDGLTGMLTPDDIQELLERQSDPQKAADELVALAVERGGEDNVTVVLVDIEVGPAAEPEAASAPGATAVAGEPPAPGGDGPSASSGATQIIARAEERATADAPPQKTTPAAARKPFPWVRLAVGAGVLVLLVVATWVGVRLYVDRQWYVGVQDGNVAVFNGIPAKPLGLDLSRLADVTDVPAAPAERLQPWRGLEDGITADSRAAADALVEQIRADVAQAQGSSGVVP